MPRRRALPLLRVYETLLAEWGPQGWWPGRTRAEIIVGAILTQNTAWTNVEKAIRRLRRERAVTFEALHPVPQQRLAQWIRPAGYFNVKARRLKAFAGMLQRRFGGRLGKLFALDTEALRRLLLEVNGIGPETADSILLYAGGRPVFVVDAYTRRFLARHGWCAPDAAYDDIASLFAERLPRRASVYNECHALIVRLGKEFCGNPPRCETCPLKGWLPRGRPARI